MSWIRLAPNISAKTPSMTVNTPPRSERPVRKVCSWYSSKETIEGESKGTVRLIVEVLAGNASLMTGTSCANDTR